MEGKDSSIININKEVIRAEVIIKTNLIKKNLKYFIAILNKPIYYLKLVWKGLPVYCADTLQIAAGFFINI